MKTVFHSPLHRMRYALTGFLLSILVFGLLAAPTPKHEIFPYFCWFLFAQTPGTEDNFELVITAFDGQALGQTQSFMTSPLVTNRGAESSTNAHRIIEALGQAVISGDRIAIKKHRVMLEGNYFDKPVSYLIQKKIYDPIQYRRTGKADISLIATFHDGQPPELNP
ncbi:MAG: hypothetical protein AAF649_08985 [Verrucomicrobiota bacterium]